GFGRVVREREKARADNVDRNRAGRRSRLFDGEAGREPERRTAAERAFDTHFAAHQFDQTRCDRQPQTGAFMAASGGGVDLSELVENGRDLVRRNADTGILDADGDGQLAVADLPADIDENVAALGELHRVANQVGGDLAEAPDIADDAEWQVRIDPDD